MKAQTIIKTDAANITFGYWDDSEEEFIPVETQDDITRAAGLLGVTVEMMDALVMFAGNISGLIGSDLRDIWRRLDEAGVP